MTSFLRLSPSSTQRQVSSHQRQASRQRSRRPICNLMPLLLLLLLLDICAAQTPAPAAQPGETSLGQPECTAVGTEFVCDINLLRASATTEPPVVVQAALTCPLGTAGLNLTDTDPRSCGCTAILTEEANTNATARPPRQCSCHYCQDNPNQPLDLAINCSTFTQDPYVRGTCKAIACDGTCLDDDTPATPATQTPINPNVTTTQSPVTTTQPPTLPATTVAPSNVTTINVTTATTEPPNDPPPNHPYYPTGTIPCPEQFCPDNKKIPMANRDLVVDMDRKRTCAALEATAMPTTPEECLEVSRFGALCCTQLIDPLKVAPEPTSPPTQPSTTVVPIRNSFLVYNTQGLTASVLRNGPERSGLSKAYAVFVQQVVEEVGSISPQEQDAVDVNQTRYLRSRTEPQPQPTGYLRSSNTENQLQRRRRRLSVTYDASSAQVYTFLDADCPTTVPFNSSCAVAYGSYDLFLFQEEDPESIEGQYTNYTQQAIDRGLLNDTLTRVDPFTWLVVEQATNDLVPPLPFDEEATRSPQSVAEEGGYDEYFMVGLGLSIAVVVVCFVAIMCASDMSGHSVDDESVDPWEKEKSRKNLLLSTHSSRGKEKAPSEKSITDPKTDRQEYMMYLGQIEQLIAEKVPEESDNIDDLMDLFYGRELMLIATLEHMPDASEHLNEDEHMMYNNDNSANLHDSFWDDEGSSDEFAEETRDGSEQEEDAEAEAAAEDYAEEFQRNTQTIEEGEEGEEDTEREEEDDIAKEPEPEPTGGEAESGDFDDEEVSAGEPAVEEPVELDGIDETSAGLAEDAGQDSDRDGGDIGSSAKQQEDDDDIGDGNDSDEDNSNHTPVSTPPDASNSEDNSSPAEEWDDEK